jgi:hypothetical protein
MKTFSEAEIQNVFETLCIDTEEKRIALRFTSFSDVATQIPIQVVSRLDIQQKQA